MAVELLQSNNLNRIQGKLNMNGIYNICKTIMDDVRNNK